METLQACGNINGSFRYESCEALEAGLSWLGPSYVQIGRPTNGVFVSADQKRRSRIDRGSITGGHATGSSSRFEIVRLGIGVAIVNNYIHYKP